MDNIGVVGLGVMGANLALNVERRGFGVVGYDRSPEKTRAFVERAGASRRVAGVDSPAALMAALERPRRVLMMVPAGAPVDEAIAHLRPHLEAGDIVIDGGNSHFRDTDRRSRELAAGGFHFLASGDEVRPVRAFDQNVGQNNADEFAGRILVKKGNGVHRFKARGIGRDAKQAPGETCVKRDFEPAIGQFVDPQVFVVYGRGIVMIAKESRFFGGGAFCFFGIHHAAPPARRSARNSS